jgi:hypothetical protein
VWNTIGEIFAGEEERDPAGNANVRGESKREDLRGVFGKEKMEVGQREESGRCVGEAGG